MENYEKFLPLGSVVLLNNGKKRVMITGFYITSKTDKTKIYDYIGCVYPEGIFDSDKNILFNHSDIKQIYAIGYSDEEEKKFKEELKNAISKLEEK